MTTDGPDPAAVIEAFGLPGPVTGWEPVGGAWSNRVYRLDAGGRRYAVKEVLAILHGLRIRPRDRSRFPVTSTATADRWPELTEAARRREASWISLMEEAAPGVALIADLARAAGFRPDQEVMTHGDIDQKNLLLTASGPALCDWDLAAPLVPRRELADVAMSLAAWTETAIAREVVRSYRRAGGDDTPIEPADLGQSMMIGLDWVAFNVERAIGLRPAATAEVSLARGIVPGLLGAIPAQATAASRVRDLDAPMGPD